MIRDNRKMKRIQKITVFTLFGCVMILLLFVSLSYWNHENTVFTDVARVLSVISGAIALIDMAAVFILNLVIDICESNFKQAVKKWAKDFLSGVIAGGIIVLVFGDNKGTLFHIGMLKRVLEYGVVLWIGSSLGKFWSRKFTKE